MMAFRRPSAKAGQTLASSARAISPLKATGRGRSVEPVGSVGLEPRLGDAVGQALAQVDADRVGGVDPAEGVPGGPVGRGDGRVSRIGGGEQLPSGEWWVEVKVSPASRPAWPGLSPK